MQKINLHFFKWLELIKYIFLLYMFIDTTFNTFNLFALFSFNVYTIRKRIWYFFNFKIFCTFCSLLSYRWINSIGHRVQFDELCKWWISFYCLITWSLQNGINNNGIFRVAAIWQFAVSPSVMNNTMFLCAKISSFFGKQLLMKIFNGNCGTISPPYLHTTFCFNCPNDFTIKSNLVFSNSLFFGWTPKST